MPVSIQTDRESSGTTTSVEVDPTSQSRLSVVHLINGLGAGGAEHMLVKVLSGMNTHRFRSVVVTLTDGGAFRAPLEALGVEVISLGMRRGRPSIKGFLSLIRVLRRERPQIVQTWLYHADLIGLIASWITRVPVCAWNIRVSSLDRRAYSHLSWGVLRACARLSGRPELVIVNSEAGRKAHISVGYHPREWKVIGNGFDLEVFRPDPGARHTFRAAHGVSDQFVVGLVARYDPMKDHANFLKAARRFDRMCPSSRFVLVGTGVDSENRVLTSQIRELGLEGKVILLGEQGDMPTILPAFDVLTLSSSFGEGFSNAIGEGMACGVPCVVTNVGDMAAVVGPTGRVVPPGEPDALAGAWRELELLGQEGRSMLGAAARTRVRERFGLEAVVSQYEAAYLELAAGLGEAPG